MSRRRRVRIFVSYSHLDREWFGKLRPLLKFPSVEHVHIWHDQELRAGDEWDKEIRAELGLMDIFLCMLSNHFIASDYITKVEVKSALKRCRDGATIIVPLLICDMTDRDVGKFKKYNPLPAWQRSWRSFEMNGGHTMDAHQPIRQGLYDAIDKARSKLKREPAERPGEGTPSTTRRASSRRPSAPPAPFTDPPRFGEFLGGFGPR